MLLYYIVYPIYAITWFPISIQGIMDKNNKEWSHTIHTRSMNIDELEKLTRGKHSFPFFAFFMMNL